MIDQLRHRPLALDVLDECRRGGLILGKIEKQLLITTLEKYLADAYEAGVLNAFLIAKLGMEAKCPKS